MQITEQARILRNADFGVCEVGSPFAPYFSEPEHAAKGVEINSETPVKAWARHEAGPEWTGGPDSDHPKAAGPQALAFGVRPVP